VAVRVKDFADRMQPVVDEAAPLAVHSRAHSAAPVMPDHDDVLDPQDVDRELEHGEIVGVLRRREIGDVSVHEQLAGVEVHDFVGGHPAIGAADPQILRRLLVYEAPEKAGVGTKVNVRCPLIYFLCCAILGLPLGRLGWGTAMDSAALHELVAQVRGTTAALAEAEQRVASFTAELAQQDPVAQPDSKPAQPIRTPIAKRRERGALYVLRAFDRSQRQVRLADAVGPSHSCRWTSGTTRQQVWCSEGSRASSLSDLDWIFPTD
jgi:hypothetical protein